MQRHGRLQVVGEARLKGGREGGRCERSGQLAVQNQGRMEESDKGRVMLKERKGGREGRRAYLGCSRLRQKHGFFPSFGLLDIFLIV